MPEILNNDLPSCQYCKHRFNNNDAGKNVVYVSDNMQHDGFYCEKCYVEVKNKSIR